MLMEVWWCRARVDIQRSLFLFMIKISRSRIRPLEHGAAVSASTRLSLCSSFLIVQLLKIFLKENQNDVRPSNLQGRIAVTAEPTTRMQDFVVLINSSEFWWLKCYPVGGWWGVVGGGGNMSVAKTSVRDRMQHYIQELCNECHQPHSHIPKQARASHLSSPAHLFYIVIISDWQTLYLT